MFVMFPKSSVSRSSPKVRGERSQSPSLDLSIGVTVAALVLLSFAIAALRAALVASGAIPT